MTVKIKAFTVDMEVKNKGIEFAVHDKNEKFLGDFYVTKAGVEWCRGKTKQRNGVRRSWETIAAMMVNTPRKKKKRKQKI